MKICMVEAGHWHAPMYGDAMVSAGFRIAAVSDQDKSAAEKVARRFQCPAYSSFAEMIENERPDLIFAFGIHDQMTGIAQQLVNIGVPFVMEKPMGIWWKDLVPVAETAEAKGLFAGVDLVSRCYGLVKRLMELKGSGGLGPVTAFYHRLFAGDPHRYAEWGVPWVVQKARSGGGCLFNFGPHVLDLFMLLTGEPIESVYCATSRTVHGLEVEEYAGILARSPSGSVGNLEVAYLCPGSGYERYFSVSSTKLLVSTANPSGGTIRYRDGRTETVEEQAPDWALLFVRETLERFQAGRPPVATIRDMVGVLRAMNAAQESAETGRVVRIS